MSNENNKVTVLKPSVAKYIIPQEKNEFKISFRISERLSRQIEVMLVDARLKLPWKTSTDFFRWAVFHGLSTISAELKDSRFTNMFEQLNTHYEIVRKQMFRRASLELLESTRQEVGEMERLGGGAEVPRFLREVEANLKRLEINFWTEKVKKQFYAEFGDQLKQGRVSVKPSKAEPVADEEE